MIEVIVEFCFGFFFLTQCLSCQLGPRPVSVIPETGRAGSTFRRQEIDLFSDHDGAREPKQRLGLCVQVFSLICLLVLLFPFIFFGLPDGRISFLIFPARIFRPLPTEPLSASASASSQVSRQEVAAWESWGSMALGGRHDKSSSAETPSPRSHEQICVLTDEEPPPDGKERTVPSSRAHPGGTLFRRTDPRSPPCSGVGLCRRCHATLFPKRQFKARALKPSLDPIQRKGPKQQRVLQPPIHLSRGAKSTSSSHLTAHTFLSPFCNHFQPCNRRLIHLSPAALTPD